MGTDSKNRDFFFHFSLIRKNHFFFQGTFHHVCANILRKYGNIVGLSPGYSIVDASDASKLVDSLIQKVQPVQSENRSYGSPKKLDHWSVQKSIGRLKVRFSSSSIVSKPPI
jgi:superfamily I DNA/RNA helicase